jgi:hypothetical protein
MLQKLYSSKTEKELNSLMNIYVAILIISIVLPIVFSTITYFINGKIYLTRFKLLIIIMIWSLYNVNYLKKRCSKTTDH